MVEPTGPMLAAPAVGHPKLEAIQAELHARLIDQIVEAARIRRVTFLADGASSLDQAATAFSRWAGQAQDGAAVSGQFTIVRGGRTITFERHGEFVTLTWRAAADDRKPWPEAIGLEHFGELQLVAATRIDLTETAGVSAAALATFNPASLCYSEIYNGQAQVATDFLSDADGFTHFEVAVKNCGPLRRGVIVRRLLEIESYRSLILLALPLARSISPAITANETKLRQTMERVAQSTSMLDSRSSLDDLHRLSAEVNTNIEETAFRFGASQAYGDVLRTRLARLQEVAIGEFTTIDRYLSNRVGPAIATCSATDRRLSLLATKLQRAAELLNAQITLNLQIQNQDILDAISQTSRRQYRLQETVEGLSIVAITYYVLAILSYVFDGISHLAAIDKGLVMLIAAPFVLFAVWSTFRRLRRRADAHGSAELSPKASDSRVSHTSPSAEAGVPRPRS